MRRIPLLIVLILLLTGAGTVMHSAYTVRLAYPGLKVDPQDNNFALAWKAEQEEDVRLYELHRKTSYTGTFVKVHEMPGHGVGKEYKYLDTQVYKSTSEEIDYRLDVVYTNGLRQQLAEKRLNYTPTAVRRSWGSIKALFLN
jgi:hypothetical protein